MQRGLAAQRACACGAFGTGVQIGLLHGTHPGHAARQLTVLLGQRSELPARFHGRHQRLRISLQITLPGLDGRGQGGRLGTGLVGRFLMQLGGLPQRAARQLRVLGTGGDLLELCRGQCVAAQLQIGQRQLGCHVGLQRVAGVLAAEIFQRARGGVPILERNQRRGRVHHRTGADGRPRRQRAQSGHAAEVAHGVAGVARRACDLALFVDGRGLAFDQFVTARGTFRRQGQHLAVSLLGFGIHRFVEAVVRHHGPGHAAQFRRRGRLQRQGLLGHGNGLVAIAQNKQLFRSVGQHSTGARVAAEGRSKTQRAVDHLALQRGLVSGILLQRHVTQKRRVTCIGRANKRRRGAGLRTGIGHTLELFSRDGVALVLVQQLSHQEAALRCVRVLRKGGQQCLVPAHGLLHVGGQFVLLRQRVVVAGQIGQVGPDLRLRALPATGVGAAEFAVGAVAHDMVLLGLQRQSFEARTGVDRDHARLQQRRLRMQRLAAHEGGEGVGRVLDTVLSDIELAQLLVDAKLVALAHGAVDIAWDALRALQVAQADAHDAEGVVHQLAVGTGQRTQIFQAGLVTQGRAQRAELEIEHAEEGLERIVEPALLEQRPALHVEGPFGEEAARASGQHGGIGRFRLLVVAHRKQQLTAAEMCLFGVHGPRMLLHQLRQGLQRHFQLAALLLRARQLVLHAVGAGIFRVGLEEFFVARDRRLVVGQLTGGGG